MPGPLLYHAACCIDIGSPESLEAACMAKSAASDAGAFISDRSVQLHGGIGFTWECDVHIYFKRSMHNQALLGDGVHQRRKLADRLIGAIGATVENETPMSMPLQPHPSLAMATSRAHPHARTHGAAGGIRPSAPGHPSPYTPRRVSRTAPSRVKALNTLHPLQAPETDLPWFTSTVEAGSLARRKIYSSELVFLAEAGYPVFQFRVSPGARDPPPGDSARAARRFCAGSRKSFPSTMECI